jgi:hypothetical protein
MSLQRMLCSVFVLNSLFSCRSPQRISDTKDLAAVFPARNIGILIGQPLTGTSNELQGIEHDVANMEAAILGLNQGFKTRVSNDEGKIKVLTAIAEAAQNVGPDGTLLLYFSGHGDRDGQLVVRSGDNANLETDVISAMELALVLGLGRTLHQSHPTPIKRLIFVLDSCFSGQWFDGAGMQFVETFNKGFQDAFKARTSSLSALYQQFFGFSSSRANQTSRILSAKQGSLFTHLLIQSLNSLKSSHSSRISDLITETNEALTVSGSSQRGVPFALPSNDILDETLF